MAEPKSFPALARCIDILTAVRPNTIELTAQARAELEKARREAEESLKVRVSEGEAARIAAEQKEVELAFQKIE